MPRCSSARTDPGVPNTGVGVGLFLQQVLDDLKVTSDGREEVSGSTVPLVGSPVRSDQKKT